MKKIIILLLLLTGITCHAQTTTQIDSTMIVRISEIEVYPEYLVGMRQMAPECLPLIFNKAKE